MGCPQSLLCLRPQEQGVDLSTYTTAQSVEDLDDLRRQLGSDRISLWATSYGTHLALAYMKQSRLRDGDFSNVGGYAAATRRGNRESLMHINMDCASGATEERLDRIATEASQSLLGNIINAGFPEICNIADSPDLGDDFRAPFATDIPTLFVSGTLDGRTPVSNAEDVLTGFTQGQHLIIEGAGHGDELFVSSPQILTAMQRFMRGEALAVHHIKVPFEFLPIDTE